MRAAAQVKRGRAVKLSAALGPYRKLRRNPAMLGMAGVFVLRVTITALNFALISLAARALGGYAFGTYSILFSAAGLFCIVATFGQQILVMRSWSEYSSSDQQGLLKGALIFSGLACLAGSLLVAIAFYGWFAATHAPPEALAVTLYLVALSAVMTTSHLVRTALGVGTGDGIGNLSLAIPPILYLLLGFAQGTKAEIDILFVVMAAGGGTAVVVHAVLMWRKIRSRFPGFTACKARYDVPRWRARSLKLWISNALEASNQYVDVLIIGALMDPTVAGAYFVTTRLANAFAMATDAIHMFSTRHIPDLYYRREFAELDSLLDSVAGVTLAVIAVGMIAILGAGHWLLMAFSAAYVPYYGALALLSFGMAAVAAAGPSGSILMLTGHEGRYLSIIGLTVLIRTLGFLVLIPPFGVTGAVAATTVSFVAMALMLRTSARNVAGIDGSVLRLLTRFRSWVPAPAE
jgi:O-antigen/teichoic acid export membrane protein